MLGLLSLNTHTSTLYQATGVATLLVVASNIIQLVACSLQTTTLYCSRFYGVCAIDDNAAELGSVAFL